MNAFDQDYDAAVRWRVRRSPSDGGPKPVPRQNSEVLLRVGVFAREVTRVERPDAALTFVIDTSGSMAREDRLGLVSRPRPSSSTGPPRDSVAIVEYAPTRASSSSPPLPTTPERILFAIESLQPGRFDQRRGRSGLAYEVAGRAFDERANNRVILASDGVANVGRTGPEAILERVGPGAARDPAHTVGFGMGNYNDVLMEQLAD